MTTQDKQSDIVNFRRGGNDISLQKSKEKFLVKLKSDERLQSFVDKLKKGLDEQLSTEFLYHYPSNKGDLFYCPKDRDRLMEHIRKMTDSVQYCSHVLQRSHENTNKTEEVGLDNNLFVEFKDIPSPELIEKIQSDFGLDCLDPLPGLPKCFLFELSGDAKGNPIKISNALIIGAVYKCKHAEPSLISQRYRHNFQLPNDEYVDFQWHLHNTGQRRQGIKADCNAREAWELGGTYGDPNIKVAIIDSDFDLKHPDLSAPNKIVWPYDVVEYDTDPSNNTGDLGHGTSCAGVAVASRGGGKTVGIAPDCRLMPIRTDEFVSDKEEALAFLHAYSKEADVISCSWGIKDKSHTSYIGMFKLTQKVINLCVKGGRNGKGIPVFFAGGNGNELSELDGYANNPDVITIAASTNHDTKAWYSDYGDNIWVCAPSGGRSPGTLDITTIDRTGPEGRETTDYTHKFWGTSSATPLVAGVAALMLSVNAHLTCDRIKEILKDTADKIRQGNPSVYEDHWGNFYRDDYVGDERSKVFGYGRINAGKAVKMAKDELSI